MIGFFFQYFFLALFSNKDFDNRVTFRNETCYNYTDIYTAHLYKIK